MVWVINVISNNNNDEWIMMMIHHTAMRTRSHSYQLNSKSECLLNSWLFEDDVKLYIGEI